jgi:uncharacterized phage infection (PIP) family protein YhgE
MATGLNHRFIKGEQTPMEFAKTIQRDFGAFIDLRDDPSESIPDDLFTRNSYRERLDKARNELTEAKAKTQADWEHEADVQWEQDKADASKHLEHTIERLQNAADKVPELSRLLNQVNAWRPSTEYKHYRALLAEQLKEGLEDLNQQLEQEKTDAEHAQEYIDQLKALRPTVSADRKDWKTLRDSSIKRIEDYIANISNMADELDASNKKKKDWVDNLDRQLETVLA